MTCRAIYFSSSHVWMWELDHKEGWVSKKWCFWIVVLEKTLRSTLDGKEITSVNPKENQDCMYIGRTDAEAPILGPPDAKRRLIGKDPEEEPDALQSMCRRVRHNLATEQQQLTLQCCVSFCCMTVWISYMYTYIPSLLNLLSPCQPTSLGHHRALSCAIQSLCYTAFSH